MCGIVGYIGNKKASDILVDGLEKLEYRGYDSAGIAVFEDGQITIRKHKGRLDNLKESLKEKDINGHVGIGHTRWATHGEPSDINSHPHASHNGKFVIVHNGIIENYIELKEDLVKKGFRFISDTDTEVVAHLLEDLDNGDLLSTVKEATKKLSGSYALAVMCKDDPEELVAVRKDSPLIIGKGEGENFIASDIPAVLKHTRDIYLLDDDEIAVITKDNISIYDNEGNKVGKQILKVNWDAAGAEKGGYEHFMLKEIHEQPRAIRDTLRGRLDVEKHEVKLDDITITKEDLDKINKIYIVACGTAFYAGNVGKNVIEKYARIPVEVDIASEFRYRNPIIDEHTLLISISQSGETADTLAAMRLAKAQGARVLAVTNVVGSTVSREASDVLYTWAGPEIAVASTKAYSTQVVSMYLIALLFGKLTGKLSDEDFETIASGLMSIDKNVENVLAREKEIKKIAYEHFKVHDVFFLGRGLDYFLSLEGSLKMKEISYIHSEAYQAGELKHGPIALVEEGTLIIALCTQDALFEKMLSNIKEVVARGAYIVAFAKEQNSNVEKEANKVMYIDNVIDDLTVIPTVVYLQTLAYYLAVARNCDVDKPRNLAKSVTVE
ncbi:glutamine--fructose-6-phosphate transaminase (isomerizing) [Anaerofustis butyriciformans]|uniref:glutamine--fructose-6-phosphate transaminase (isomerizing) n=1 Tax=Anaerofustis TaxID=264995 RepID=UPI003F8CCDB7